MLNMPDMTLWKGFGNAMGLLRQMGCDPCRRRRQASSGWQQLRAQERERGRKGRRTGSKHYSLRSHLLS